MTEITLTPEQEDEANALAHQWDSFPFDLDDYRQIARELVALREDVKRLQAENARVLDDNDALRVLVLNMISYWDVVHRGAIGVYARNWLERARAALKAAGRQG